MFGNTKVAIISESAKESGKIFQKKSLLSKQEESLSNSTEFLRNSPGSRVPSFFTWAVRKKVEARPFGRASVGIVTKIGN